MIVDAVIAAAKRRTASADVGSSDASAVVDAVHGLQRACAVTANVEDGFLGNENFEAVRLPITVVHPLTGDAVCDALYDAMIPIFGLLPCSCFFLSLVRMFPAAAARVCRVVRVVRIRHRGCHGQPCPRPKGR